MVWLWRVIPSWSRKAPRTACAPTSSCPGFVRTPLVEKQIPEQAKELGIPEDDVIKKVMLKDTVDGEFTTVDDVAETALFLAAFPINALTGQSIVVSQGWFMNEAGHVAAGRPARIFSTVIG
jgi:NAD(P)-dependent dehydrogenase (short-subunit alcohol dehydrogenase family)